MSAIVVVDKHTDYIRIRAHPVDAHPGGRSTSHETQIQATKAFSCDHDGRG